jgi:hypothetical protein
MTAREFAHTIDRRRWAGFEPQFVYILTGPIFVEGRTVQDVGKFVQHQGPQTVIVIRRIGIFAHSPIVDQHAGTTPSP